MTDNASRAVASRRAVVGGIVGLGVGVPAGRRVRRRRRRRRQRTAATDAAPVGKTSEVPVGGGKIFAADKVVVTQPTEGDFKAFSAVCTHQGCVVAEIKGEDIDCTCHGSQVLHQGRLGRATAPRPSRLEKLTATVKGGEITVS